jgi:Tetracyclin repressor-like, C-terminal domain
MARDPIRDSATGFSAADASKRRTSAPGVMPRQVMDDEVVRPLAAWLKGEQVEPRAGWLVAFLLGLVVARYGLRSGPLVSPAPKIWWAWWRPCRNGT